MQLSSFMIPSGTLFRVACALALLLAVTALPEVDAQPVARKVSQVIHQGADFLLVSTDEPGEVPVSVQVYFKDISQEMRGSYRSFVAFQSAGGETDLDDDPVVTSTARPVEYIRTKNHMTADEFVFGGAIDATQTEKRISKRLAEKVASIDRICKLTDVQKRKLELAGRGDATRLLDQVERLKVNFGHCEKSWTVAQIQAWASGISAERQRLQPHLESEGAGEGTLFAKVLKSVLTPEQLATLDRRLFNPVAPKPPQEMRLPGAGVF